MTKKYSWMRIRTKRISEIEMDQNGPSDAKHCFYRFNGFETITKLSHEKELRKEENCLRFRSEKEKEHTKQNN